MKHFLDDTSVSEILINGPDEIYYEQRGVLLNAFGPHTVRAVTHLDVGRAQCEHAARLVATLLFPLSALCSLVLLLVAFDAASSVPEVAVLPIGLPQLPFHLRLDGLSAFFLLLILMNWVLLPPIKQAMRKRDEQLRGDEEAAERAVVDSEQVRRDYDATLAEALSAAGYTTAAFVDSNCFALTEGFFQGFGEVRGGYELLIDGDTVRELSDKPIKAGGASVIDCGGRTLMPGLIDCHVHLYRTLLPPAPVMLPSLITVFALPMVPCSSSMRATSAVTS